MRAQVCVFACQCQAYVYLYGLVTASYSDRSTIKVPAPARLGSAQNPALPCRRCRVRVLLMLLGLQLSFQL